MVWDEILSTYIRILINHEIRIPIKQPVRLMEHSYPGTQQCSPRQALARRHLAKKRVAKMRAIQMRVWPSQDFPDVWWIMIQHPEDFRWSFVFWILFFLLFLDLRGMFGMTSVSLSFASIFSQVLYFLSSFFGPCHGPFNSLETPMRIAEASHNAATTIRKSCTQWEWSESMQTWAMKNSLVV